MTTKRLRGDNDRKDQDRSNEIVNGGHISALSHINVPSRSSSIVRAKPVFCPWRVVMGIPVTVAEYLLDHQVAYDLVPHPRAETARASAVARGIAADRVVKAVVVKGSDGFKLAVLPASRHIRFERLRRVLGDDVNLAGEEQIEALFVDCEPGSVPAFGAAYGLEVVVDDSLAEQPDLYVEGGDHANLIHLSGSSFRTLMQAARHGHFTDALEPA
jgi:Ala-tRNA(Pro) deacylase